MNAALDINLPHYASAIVPTSGIIEAISPLSASSSASLGHASQ